ncbi:MAG TPA: hypothetical protein VMW17_06240 [Candidatus Binatia bacterium]|nr:hypothetical protein [Candidatus Binatia bacterium]
MRRTLGIIAVTIATVVLIELLVQTPLSRWLQPVILTPADGVAVTPPLHVQWEGPPRMDIVLAADGSPAQALGVHPSPCDLDAADLSKPGMYRLRVSLPMLGTLIQSERRFVVIAPTPVPSPAALPDPRVAQLTSSLNEVQAAQQRVKDENATLQQENTDLRQELADLRSNPQRSAQAPEDDSDALAAQAERLAQLSQENQTLRDQMGVLQWQLNAALVCRVWGYYAFSRAQTYLPTRRTITVTNSLGELFRSQAECEAIRFNDPTTASRCFCVGAPWSG